MTEYPDIDFQIIDLNGFIKAVLSIINIKDGTPISTPMSTPMLTVSEMEVLELIKNNQKITRDEIAKQLNVSVNAIKRHIANLKKKEAVKRLGDNRNGYWEIQNKEKND